MEQIRVAIFDDNDSFRDSLYLLLQENGFLVVGSYSDCNQIIENIKNSQVAVVLMDIDMPGINGIEGVKILRKNFPSVLILMVTVFQDDDKVYNAIEAGADGYILKNADPKHLLSAISEVYNGGAPMTPGIARKILLKFRDELPGTPGENYNISAREKEVLSLLVNGLSYKMIADKLEITYDTVRAHMKKIYQKLQVSSMTEAVAKAIQQKIFPGNGNRPDK